MPRAHRYYLSHHLWHLTHRCHEKQFLLRFAYDRNRYLGWLFEARNRYGLQTLGYAVTSNHVHLLVRANDEHVISRSLQLAAGRTAQAFNRRKGRNGAFWEDRYHATAIQADDHLLRCLVYIDLNMVRAGVVRHPAEWASCSYSEIQQPSRQERIIDLSALSALCGFSEVERFRAAHRGWVQDALAHDSTVKDPMWSHSVAVGTRTFVESIRKELGTRATHRNIENSSADTYVLREARSPYVLNFAA